MSQNAAAQHAAIMAAVLGNNAVFQQRAGVYFPVPVFLRSVPKGTQDGATLGGDLRLSLDKFYFHTTTNVNVLNAVETFGWRRTHAIPTKTSVSDFSCNVPLSDDKVAMFAIDLGFYNAEKDVGGVVASKSQDPDYRVSENIFTISPDNNALHYYVVDVTPDGVVTLMSPVHLFSEFDEAVSSGNVPYMQRMLGMCVDAGSAVGYTYLWTVRIPRGNITDKEFSALLRGFYWRYRNFYLPVHTFEYAQQLAAEAVDVVPQDNIIFTWLKIKVVPDIFTLRVIVIFAGLFLVRVAGDLLGYQADVVLWVALLTAVLSLGNGLAEAEREIVRLSEVIKKIKKSQT